MIARFVVTIILLCQTAYGLNVFRVHVNWTAEDDSFELGTLIKENSGTKSLYRRVYQQDYRGSFKAVLKDTKGKEKTQYGSIGIGYSYKKLVRNLTFRFKPFSNPHELIVYGANSVTGTQEEILRSIISPQNFKKTLVKKNIVVKTIKKSPKKDFLILTFYSENYKADRQDQFWKDVRKFSKNLITQFDYLGGPFPGIENFEIRGMFYPSNYEKDAFDPLKEKYKLQSEFTNKDYSLIPESPTFLGLFFPYWFSREFSRIYDIVYPTREVKMRNGFGQTAYDYPFVLTDSQGRYESGNYNAFTAVPAHSEEALIMLYHGFGHYFGLQEEYSRTGTELLFAENSEVEPWSANITLSNNLETIKWKSLVNLTTDDIAKKYGAFSGGYGGVSMNHQHTYIPGKKCVMNYETGLDFCDICKEAIRAKIEFDLGIL